MKNLNQILPLYLGARVIGEHPTKNRHFEYRLDGVHLDGILLSGEGVDHAISPSKFGNGLFVLLRPITEITETEARDFCTYSGWRFVEHTAGGGSASIVFEYMDIAKQGELGKVTLYNDGTFGIDGPLNVLSYESFTILRKAGLDLDGLIEGKIAKPITP